MNFADKQRLYAQLIVQHGLNVQPGQFVNISTEPIHRDFALMVATAAYERGARYVQLSFGDPELERIRLLKGPADAITFVPPYVVGQFDYALDQRGGNLRILGPRDPNILSDLPPTQINTMRLAQRQALKRFYDDGIGKSQVHWSIAAAATPAWGQKVFPALGPDEACARLWDEIFRICRVDQPDALALWQQHNERLKQRAKRLTDLGVETIQFVGPGTDLRVKLSPRARFAGGSERGPHGVDFEPNLPTEEVFTTPDWRGTTGHVATTRPFFINGKLIKGLKIEFRAGVVTSFTADEGQETFAAYIDSDAGGRRLGEVALVGIDSPIFQSGLVFEEILFDENAACHIAVGMAYKFCVTGGPDMTPEELDAVGCNDSHVHTDMMISSEKVDVIATTYGGQTVPLLKAGQWVI